MSAKIFCILKKKTCFSNQIETSMKFDLTLFSPCWTLTRVWVSDIRWQDLSDFSQLAFYNSPERPTAGKKLKWNIFSDKILIFFCISWNLQTNFHLYSVSDPVGGMNSKRACHPPPAFQWPPNSAHCTSQQQFVCWFFVFFLNGPQRWTIFVCGFFKLILYKQIFNASQVSTLHNPIMPHHNGS